MVTWTSLRWTLLLYKISRQDNEVTSNRLGKVFENHIFNKGLVSRIFSELSNSTLKNLVRKWVKDMVRNEQTLHREDTQTANKKTFSIVSHQGNADRSHSETTTHLSEWLEEKGGKRSDNSKFDEEAERWDPHTSTVGM